MPSKTKSVRQSQRTSIIDKSSQTIQAKPRPASQRRNVARPREKKVPDKAKNGKPITDRAKLQLLKENKFLEQELRLAKKPQYYFVLNLKEKKIELRARGMVLKSWTAKDIRYSGPAIPLEIITLAQKTALKPPQRLLINPAENQKEENSPAKSEEKKENKTNQDKSGAVSGTSTSDSFEVPALEITDMPTSYELIMDNGLQISVRCLTKDKGKLRLEMISWYVIRPLKNLVLGGKGVKPRMIIYFEKERDAQGIYWAFIDGLNGLIWLP
ncbi:MAG: hypothetical protein H5U07_03470 [Candidatus Aminicenantes bacterium]|nr:hypothetical protein [Candidatus Aminicenantes bacterium]